MSAASYIQVILPLRLDWEPWYRSEEDLPVGTRVRVKFAGKVYVAVVSASGGVPDIPLGKVQPLEEVASELERISAEQIGFWRFIASYYLCSIGEVYRMAYPAGKTAVESKRANKKGAGVSCVTPSRLDEEGKSAVRSILEAFADHQPVLLEGFSREAVYAELTRRTLADGRDVLLLRPDAPRLSYATQRELAKAVRNATPLLVEGGKSNLFLPFTKLGLVIVDDEHSASYKHSASSPRYHGRDAALALASQHGASVLLASATPSLESVSNARGGKFAYVSMRKKGSVAAKPFVIGTGDEYRKSGMVGPLSRKLIERLDAVGGRKLVLTPWNLDEPLRYRRLKTVKFSALSSEKLGAYDLVAVLNAEALLSRDDFRADEKALQMLRYLENGTRGELVIQTSDASHPLFSMEHDKYLDLLLEERRQFGFPPFSRLVEVRIQDTNEKRREKMKSLLSRSLGGSLQVLMPKDRTLSSRKSALVALVAEFEKEYSYPGHIVIDVDP